MTATFINYDTTGWSHDYFMMWDDPVSRRGRHRACGYSCSKHTLYVKSEVKQTVFIGAHTYRYYTYADGEGSCPVRSNDSQLDNVEYEVIDRIFDDKATKNVIVREKDGEKNTFEDGDEWLSAIVFEAGEEIEITVEFNWDRLGITKDWAVTAWGVEGGDISVRHSDEIETENFSYTPKGEMTQVTLPE